MVKARCVHKAALLAALCINGFGCDLVIDLSELDEEPSSSADVGTDTGTDSWEETSSTTGYTSDGTTSILVPDCDENDTSTSGVADEGTTSISEPEATTGVSPIPEPASDEELCAANCAIETTCGFEAGQDYPLSVCIEDCLYNLSVEGGEACGDSMRDFVECIGSLSSCDDIHACSAQADAVASCDGGCGYGIVTDGVSCEIDFLCDGGPHHAMECEGDTCSCLLEGEEVATCPAMNVCNPSLPFDVELTEFSEACCGWNLAAFQ